LKTDIHILWQFTSVMAGFDILSYVASSPIRLKLYVLLRRAQEIHIVNVFSQLSD